MINGNEIGKARMRSAWASAQSNQLSVCSQYVARNQSFFMRTVSLLGAHAKFLVTVKFLNYRTQENFAVIYVKFKKRGQTFGYFVKKMQME